MLRGCIGAMDFTQRALKFNPYADVKLGGGGVRLTCKNFCFTSYIICNNNNLH